MANTGVKGRIVDKNGEGIHALTVNAVDFDPFFHEDDILAHGKTDNDGNFNLSYAEDAYSFWKGDRKPDIVVQIFGPVHRLRFETKEVKNVTDPILEVPLITIHRNHIDGWLVTHATLKPKDGDPVYLFKGNEIKHLVVGDTVFPAVTQAAKAANTSIRLMNLAFDVDSIMSTEPRYPPREIL